MPASPRAPAGDATQPSARQLWAEAPSLQSQVHCGVNLMSLTVRLAPKSPLAVTDASGMDQACWRRSGQSRSICCLAGGSLLSLQRGVRGMTLHPMLASYLPSQCPSLAEGMALTSQKQE